MKARKSMFHGVFTDNVDFTGDPRCIASYPRFTGVTSYGVRRLCDIETSSVWNAAGSACTLRKASVEALHRHLPHVSLIQGAVPFEDTLGTLSSHLLTSQIFGNQGNWNYGINPGLFPFLKPETGVGSDFWAGQADFGQKIGVYLNG